MNEQMIMIEKLRKGVLAHYIMRILALIAMIIMSILALRRGAFDAASLVYIGVPFLVLVIFLFSGMKAKQNYRAYYKSHYIDAMIKSAIPSAQYMPDHGFSSSMISNTGLIYLSLVKEFRYTIVLIQMLLRSLGTKAISELYMKTLQIIGIMSYYHIRNPFPICS